MSKRTIILKNKDRELPVEIIADELSKTIHLRVELIDTQLIAGLIQDELIRHGDEYKVWLHVINRRIDIGIEVCEATLTVELQDDTLIMKPLERPRYD